MTKSSKQTYRAADWAAWAEEDSARQLPAVRNNLVLPAREAPRVDILPPEATNWDVNLSPTSQPAVQLKTTYVDRAKGFQLATVPLALGVGFLAVLIAVLGLGTPIGAHLLLWFGLAFMLVWLAGYAMHQVIGPDGALFTSVFGAYRLLRAEQKERHRRMRRMERDL